MPVAPPATTGWCTKGGAAPRAVGGGGARAAVGGGGMLARDGRSDCGGGGLDHVTVRGGGGQLPNKSDETEGSGDDETEGIGEYCTVGGNGEAWARGGVG